MRVTSLFLCLLGAASSWVASPADAQNPPITQSSVPALIGEAAKFQIDDMRHSSWGLRYRVHRVTDHDDTLRDLVESSDGNVARTLERNGRRLTPEQNEAEEQRLRSLTTEELARRRRSSDSTDKFAVELIGVMPQAMTYTLTPGQPQLQQFSGPQVVLDYVPNPAFHPASTAQSLLAGIAGRLWIDAETHHLLRLEINITRNLNLVFGILAHVYQGGTMVYEQHPVGDGHYAYNHIAINVRLRELMVKTVPYNSTLDTTNMTLLPTQPSLKQAVTMLLTEP